MDCFSFDFGTKNSREDFGLIATSLDILMPEKRGRFQEIPYSHGAYDYGAKWYNMREVRVTCKWIASETLPNSRHDIREVAYWLSQKKKLVFDIEPDKYYIGQLLSPNDLIMRYNRSKSDVFGSSRTTDGEFELSFICEPFAYRDIEDYPIKNGVNFIPYEGTIEAPCLIVLKNTSPVTISSVKLIATRRK